MGILVQSTPFLRAAGTGATGPPEVPEPQPRDGDNDCWDVHPDKVPMLSYESAVAKILSHARPLPKERIGLEESSGRFLAQNITARRSAPAFAQSDMDGFGVRFADQRDASPLAPVTLPVAATVRAGDRPTDGPPEGCAVRIMTGAPVPSGADTVVVQESCDILEGLVTIRKAAPLGANIRRPGDEFVRGARLLSAGTYISPPVVGLLASLGISSLLVYRRPTVTVLGTGSELVAPGKQPRPGQIFDSNTFALGAALKELGIGELALRRVKDDPRALRRAMQQALDTSDVVITAGGVSVGDYDFMKQAAAEVGVRSVFWRTAVKPGKPNFFGVYSPAKGAGMKAEGATLSAKRLVFGLPGNPVSALVSFHQFVKPAILRLSGQPRPRRLIIPATLSEGRTKRPGRLEWVRGQLTASGGAVTVAPTRGQKSHMLGGLAHANCLITFPAASAKIQSDSEVLVELLLWGNQIP